MQRLLCGMAMIVLAGAAQVPNEDGAGTAIKEAKGAYEKAVEKARAELIGKLKKKAEVAQKAGDLKALDAIENEIKAFEEKQELPRGVPTSGYVAETQAAKKRLETAYLAAIKGYTRAGKVAEAKDLQQELDELKSTDVAGADSIFRPGSVFEGRRTSSIGPATSLVLKLASVDKGNFKGILAYDEREFPVAGKVENGKVTFEVTGTDTKLRHKYAGTVKGMTIVAKYSGTAPDGRAIQGDAEARLKAPK